LQFVAVNYALSLVFSYSFNERRITNNEQPASQLNTHYCLLLTETVLQPNINN